jgi:translation initiation factor 2-alpha kinase 3
MDIPNEPEDTKNELGPTPLQASTAGSGLGRDPSGTSGESSMTSNLPEVDESIAGVVARAIAKDLPLTHPESGRHATTFMFAMVEGRCKTEAKKIINSRRRRQDQLSEDHPDVCALAESIFRETVIGLKRTSLVPDKVDIPGPDERREYLKAFDARLSAIAIQQQPVCAVDRITYDTIENSKLYSISEDASSLFEKSNFLSRSHSRALVPQPTTRAPQGMASSPLDTLIYPSGTNTYQQESAYRRKFSEIGLLGKGGFGQVFRARHKLDDQDYAVKQIRVSASQLRSIYDQVQLEHLLKELRALAKLQHRNVVRYYDSWCEYRAASWRSTRSGQQLLENGPTGLR